MISALSAIQPPARADETPDTAHIDVRKRPQVAATASPTDRTQYVAFSQIARSPSRPAPAYLASAKNSPAARRHPGIEQQLTDALDHADRQQRLIELRALSRKAPEHPSVLFHMAMQLVMAGQEDQARKVGQKLQAVDAQRYRKLYDWAEDWSRTAHPVVAQTPAAPALIPVRNANAVRPVPGHRVHKTQLLAVPIPGRPFAPATAPVVPYVQPHMVAATRPVPHARQRSGTSRADPRPRGESSCSRPAPRRNGARAPGGAYPPGGPLHRAGWPQSARTWRRHRPRR